MSRSLWRLFRLPLALANGASALGGCLLFPGEVAWPVLAAAFGGVSLLAAAGSALNQVLERDLDCRMVRTRCRPLPLGQLTPARATTLGVVSGLAGLLVLGFAGGPLPALLGALALAWYLGVYTPLKRRSALALLVGGVSGALPPVIGCCLAGGSPTDYRAVLLAGLLYLWQVPHFWLLQQQHADDYRRAGIPLWGDAGTPTILWRLWLAALGVATLLLPALGLVGGRFLWGGAIVVLLSGCLPRGRAAQAFGVCLNAFPLLVTVALAAGRS
ncbi:MAG TPA: protoheme IX farnesyltransferase [Geobacteraceae bacterium]